MGANTGQAKYFPRAGAFGSSPTNVVSEAKPWELAQRQSFVSQDTLANATGAKTAYRPITPYPGRGGGMGCFTAPVEVKAPDGLVAFGALPKRFQIVNETGTHDAELLVHEDFEGEMIVLDGEKLVTLDHLMKDGEQWIPASAKYPENPRVHFKGTVYNMHVLDAKDFDEQSYVLFNGDVAHNMKAAPFEDEQRPVPWWYGY